MPQTPSADDPAADPAWAGTARFLEGRVPPGLRIVAPDSFASLLGTPAEPDPAILPDWAVVPATDGPPVALIRRLLAETTPVYANDGYVVFARRPTFGLADMRSAGPVRALAERAASDPPPRPSPPAATPVLAAATVPPPPPAPAPSFLEASPPRAIRTPEAAMTPIQAPRAADIPRSTLPPEALALQVLAPRPEPAVEPQRPAPPPLPAAAAPAIPPRAPQPDAARPAAPEAPRPAEAASSVLKVSRPAPPVAAPPVAPELPPPVRTVGGGTGWGALPARVAALLGDVIGRRVATGRDADGLAAASLPSSALLSNLAPGLPDGTFDAALLRPTPDLLAPELAEAARALRPGGLALVVAENAESLGRRLAAALGRPAPPPGLVAATIRGAVHAAGLVPLRLDGHSLDSWRATAEAPPAGLAPSDPAAALLEEAGEAAGPRHAAWILLLARKP